MPKTSFLSRVKNLLVSAETKPRTVAFGPLKGLTFDVNLQHQMQFILGLYEAELHPWLLRFTRDIDTFVDVGAAFGSLTVFGAAKTPATQILAFEPDANAYRRIETNLALNGFYPDDIAAFQYMVSDTHTDTTRRLNDYAKQIRTPSCIKVDVEGAEADVLRGADRLLAMPDVRWIIEVHSEPLEGTCLEILNAAGYETEVIDHAWWRSLIPEARPIAHNRWIAARPLA